MCGKNKHIGGKVCVTVRNYMRKIFSLSGSLLLIICFFLPMLRGCKTDYSPFLYVKETGQQYILTGHCIISKTNILIGAIVPHLFGLIVLLSIILFLFIKRVPRIVNVSHWGILLLGYCLNIYFVVMELFNLSSIVNEERNTIQLIQLAYIFIAVAFCILIPLEVVRSLKRQGKQGSPRIIVTVSQKILALMSFLWFLWLLLSSDGVLYGIYPAMASCVLIYLGTPLFTLSLNNKQPIPESLGVADEGIKKAKRK